MDIVTGNFGFLMQGVLVTLELTVLGTSARWSWAPCSRSAGSGRSPHYG